MKPFDQPVIVGSMFYEGDDLILDLDGGKIDENKAADRIDKMRTLSKEYSVPFLLDIEIPSSKLAPKIINFIGKNKDVSFWISSFTKEMRNEACKIALKESLEDRVFYSTLNYLSDEKEFSTVADLGIRPIIQIFNPNNPYSEGYIVKAEELLNLAKKSGIHIENSILLPTILDFGSIPIALSTIPLLKEKYHLPVCIPSIGPVYKWANQYSQNTRRLLVASTITYTISAHADLIHIGTVKRAFIAFPVVSLVNQFERIRKRFK